MHWPAAAALPPGTPPPPSALAALHAACARPGVGASSRLPAMLPAQCQVSSRPPLAVLLASFPLCQCTCFLPLLVCCWVMRPPHVLPCLSLVSITVVHAFLPCLFSLFQSWPSLVVVQGSVSHLVCGNQTVNPQKQKQKQTGRPNGQRGPSTHCAVRVA